MFIFTFICYTMAYIEGYLNNHPYFLKQSEESRSKDHLSRFATETIYPVTPSLSPCNHFSQQDYSTPQDHVSSHITPTQVCYNTALKF